MLLITKVLSFFLIVALSSSEVNFWIFISSFNSSRFQLHFSVYKLECINEKDSNYTKNISCFLKTISRGLNVLTSLSDFVTPLNYINANIVALMKSSANTYRTVVINNSFEVCSIMGDNAPPIVKFSLPIVSKFAPNLIHECPYEGRRIGVENIPIDLSLLPLVYISGIPRGDYRVVKWVSIIFGNCFHWILFQDVNFFDKYWNPVHWIKLYGAIQQKRFTKKHLGSTTTKPTTTAFDDTTTD